MVTRCEEIWAMRLNAEKYFRNLWVALNIFAAMRPTGSLRAQFILKIPINLFV